MESFLHFFGSTKKHDLFPSPFLSFHFRFNEESKNTRKQFQNYAQHLKQRPLKITFRDDIK